MTYTRMMQKQLHGKESTTISRIFFSFLVNTREKKVVKRFNIITYTLLRPKFDPQFQTLKFIVVSSVQCFLGISEFIYLDTIVFIFFRFSTTKNETFGELSRLHRAAAIVRRSFLSECFSRGDKLIRAFASGCNLYAVKSESKLESDSISST